MAIIWRELSLPAGSDYDLTIDIEDLTGNAVDVSGATLIKFAVSNTQNDLAAIFEKDLGAGAVVGANQTSVVITLAQADTEDLAGRYYFECRVEDGAAKSQHIVQGWLWLSGTLFPRLDP